MTRRDLAFLPGFSRSIQLPAMMIAVSASLPSQPGWAEQEPSVARGYVTAVRESDSFDMNGRRVTTTPETRFAPLGSKGEVNDSTLRDAVRVGAYVKVTGAFDSSNKAISATSVLIRDDLNKKLSGVGVICKVVSAGAEPVFQVDGYRVRIDSSTEVDFAGNMTNLAEVGTNYWVKFEGKRDKDGVLVATRAKFLPGKVAKFKAIRGVETTNVYLEFTGKGTAQASAKIGAQVEANQINPKSRVKFGGWYFTLPADEQMQARVIRVGRSLIPAYQRELSADNPSKITFQFYVIGAAKFRSGAYSSDGIVLVPQQVVKRLKSDDQLAAVIADGVAFNLQRQEARLVVETRELESAKVGSDIFLSPAITIVAEYGADFLLERDLSRFEEERGRVALALMGDAGYDPWQAPEAWRILAPKKLPGDMDSLKYGSFAGYQLSILNLQYRAAHAENPAAVVDDAAH